MLFQGLNRFEEIMFKNLKSGLFLVDLSSWSKRMAQENIQNSLA